MPGKRSTRRPARNSTRYRNFEELRAAVHAACWEELKRNLGPGQWEAGLEQTLRRFVADPDECEVKARDAFAKLRRVMLEIVTISATYHAESKRALEASTPEKPVLPPGGEYVRLLHDFVTPALLAILKHHRMDFPNTWFMSQGDYPDDASIRAAKKPLPRRQSSSKRSRLVLQLEEFNLLGLPSRSTPPYSSRFFSEREYALISLILDIGLVDEPDVKRALNRNGVTVAKVVSDETERMRLTLGRLSKWEQVAERERAAIHAACEREGRDATPEELEVVDQHTPLRGPG